LNWRQTVNELITPSTQLSSLEEIVEQLQAKKSDYRVSVFISPKEGTVSWIGGSAPNYTYIVHPMVQGHGLKESAFSIGGDFFEETLKSLLRFNTASNQYQPLPLTYLLKYHSGNYIQATHVAMSMNSGIGNMSNPTYPYFREFSLSAPLKKHIEYIEAIHKHAAVNFTVTDLNVLDIYIKQLGKYEYLQIDPDTHQARIQREGIVSITPLPSNITLPTSLTVNNETYKQLCLISQETQSPTVAIAQEGESITLISSEKTLTRSIAGLHNFHQSFPDNTINEVSFIADIKSFINVIKSFRNITQIRTEDEGAMLIHDNELFICAMNPNDQEGKVVYAKEIKCTNPLLYRFHLKELLQSNINELQPLKQVMLAISNNEKNECFLEFYTSTKPGLLPYTRIQVEVDVENIPRALKCKGNYKNITKDSDNLLVLKDSKFDMFSC
jgi:hypothetical protein